MKKIILAIETSCDETAISIIEVQDEAENLEVKVLSNVVLSQIEIHRAYGGVYPMLAKRAHAKNLIPVLDEALTKAGMKKERNTPLVYNKEKIDEFLEREMELKDMFTAFLPSLEIPPCDVIAVTSAPGLEPTLWVGINFAKALASLWGKPLMPINHMEGHIYSALLEKKDDTTYLLPQISYPALSLLISGGHTEFVLLKEALSYEVVGETQDDAVGEAFDKVARMLDLPYPGGPEISRLAELCPQGTPPIISLPRPMLYDETLNFSFSGLKTAVKYEIQKLGELTEEQKIQIAHEFQEAVVDVLVGKTLRALERYGIHTFVAGGGVSANTQIREALKKEIARHGEAHVFLPPAFLTTDNALMIALVAGIHLAHTPHEVLFEEAFSQIEAHGTARLGKESDKKV